MNDLAWLREQKDGFFRDHPDSPLLPEQQRTFSGLAYFPPNGALRFAVAVELFAAPTVVALQTSTGEVQHAVRAGQIHLTIEGQPVRLTVYRTEHGWFLPFADALAGSETYGAGRYVEPEPLEDGRLLVDFNLAYNPYCAYNDAWSCPLTPPENRLAVAVRAGEMAFVTTTAHTDVLQA